MGEPIGEKEFLEKWREAFGERPLPAERPKAPDPVRYVPPSESPLEPDMDDLPKALREVGCYLASRNGRETPYATRCFHAADELERQAKLILSEAEIDTICERWDQTGPAMQRQIVARLLTDRQFAAAEPGNIGILIDFCRVHQRHDLANVAALAAKDHGLLQRDLAAALAREQRLRDACEQALEKIAGDHAYTTLPNILRAALAADPATPEEAR